MSQTVTVQEEVQALKACIAQLRRNGRRRQFPESVRARLLALRQAGWSVKRLASEFGLAASQIYTWAKGRETPAPRIMQVEPPPRLPEVTKALPQGALQLRLGAFCITVAVAEA
jgi:transposase-like protein